MNISLLDLISAPIPVLNSLGVNLRLGLSSEDPMVMRHPPEQYRAYLTVYSPEGVLMERLTLGDIPPERRQFFDISSIARELVPQGDHLCVVHRVPFSLLSQVSHVEEPLDVGHPPDYSMFRSLVEYSFSDGGNGSVIYETPPALNIRKAGRPPSNTLTFTSKVVISELVNTYVVLIHYSMDPRYSQICDYRFGIFSMDGTPIVSDSLSMGPFSVQIIDVGRLLPKTELEKSRHSGDGLATFTFVGFTDQASVPSLVINASHQLRAISVEHTHPAQEYLLPKDLEQWRTVKSNAVEQWKYKLASR